MSRFYQRYLENKCYTKEEMPVHIQREILNREIDEQHIRQADSVTNGKHTGSKSANKIYRNMRHATRMIKQAYGYNA